MNTYAQITNRLRPEWFADGEPTEPRPESSRILIADDHAGSRLGFRMALETAGYEVTEAEDGESAVDSLRKGRADLALLDLRMPGLDGMEVLRRLRFEGIDVPVVVITAHGSISGAVRAMEWGAVDFLSEAGRARDLARDRLECTRASSTSRGGVVPTRTTSLGGAARRFADTLAVARRTLQHGHFDLSEYLLQQALDLDPDSVEANALRGQIHENLGEHHAAYQSYRRALSRDPRHAVALEGMRRYCERFGLDARSRAINPGAE